MDTAWLDSLKPGDHVAYYSAGWTRDEATVRAVARRTATRIVLAGTERDRECWVSADRGRGPRPGGYSVASRIEPLTAELASKIRRRLLIAALDRVKWGDLTTDGLEVAWAAVKAARAEGGE